MKNTTARILMAVAVLSLCRLSASAEQQDIVFPIDNHSFSAGSLKLQFVYGNTIGLAVATDSSLFPTQVFSFSLAERKVLSDFNLVNDFGARPGPPFPFLVKTANPETGHVAALGIYQDGFIKLVMLKVDRSGQFTKLWTASHPGGDVLGSTLAFNKDGSKVYVVYDDASNKRVVLYNTQDGAQLGVIDLEHPPLRSHSIIFDPVGNRAIAVADGIAYIFTPESEPFALATRIKNMEGGSNFAMAVTQDGRYLITYDGYVVTNDPDHPSDRSNQLSTFDLVQNQSSSSFLKTRYLPSGVSFAPSTNTVVMPYFGIVKVLKQTPKVIEAIAKSKYTRLVDLISLSPDGALTRTIRVTLPRRSPGSDTDNLINPASQISKSGTIAIVPTLSKRLFFIDTLTGDILNDEPVDFAFSDLRLLEDEGRLILGSQVGKLTLIDVTIGPVIRNVEVKGKETIIRGINFLAGARVLLNGEDLGLADRDPDDPGREIIIRRGRKNLPADRDSTLSIINRDGLRSQTFSFRP